MIAAPRLAGAPITWGICEVPGWGLQLSPEQVLAEIVIAGFTATELGPRGFLPDDPSEVRKQLTRHGLQLVGGFVPAVLHREQRLVPELSLVNASARTLADAGAEVLVLAAETGVSGYDESLHLSANEWSTLERGIAAVMQIGEQHGLSVALHPHFGTVIETEAQIENLLERTGVSICLDTGHLMVAGADPLAVARLAGHRIAHVHLKDVDATLAARVRSGEVKYHEAVRRGMYRPLGDGDVDIAAIVRLLHDADYRGWYVIEQDLVIDAMGDNVPALANATRSVRYLAQVASA
jgi:inosose dehydratase